MGLFGLGKKKTRKSEQESDENPSQQELLAEEKNDMIQGVEDLAVTTVKEVMVPRIDVDFISIDIPQDMLLKSIIESGHSRFPVYSGSIDNVVGVLYVKDIIKAFAQEKTVELSKIYRKAYFVPESKHIDSLLREFKRKHLHIAIAIDEYGGVSGIVCMEDIIEQIVGDIQDEFDNEREDILSMGDNIWVCDARGFVFDMFGRIPVKFEKVSWKDYDFIVQDMEGHKVNVVKIICRKKEDED